MGREHGPSDSLGGILARRALGRARIEAFDAALRASVEYAYAHPDTVRAYIRAHAQEMDEAVMQAHIDLYVNQYTLDYGRDGEAPSLILWTERKKPVSSLRRRSRSLSLSFSTPLLIN